MGEAEIGVGFVVSKEDVEAGSLAFDEVAFKEEGLGFVVDEDAGDVGDLGGHGACLEVEGVGCTEVVGYALLEVFGFADVDELTLGVVELVDAGAMGKLVFLLDSEAQTLHGIQCYTLYCTWTRDWLGIF